MFGKRPKQADSTFRSTRKPTPNHSPLLIYALLNDKLLIGGLPSQAEHGRTLAKNLTENAKVKLGRYSLASIRIWHLLYTYQKMSAIYVIRQCLMRVRIFINSFRHFFSFNYIKFTVAVMMRVETPTGTRGSGSETAESDRTDQSNRLKKT